MTDPAPTPTTPIDPPGLTPPDAAQAEIPIAHLVIIAAAAMALCGHAVAPIAPAPAPTQPPTRSPPRAGRGGFWPRLVRAIVGPVRHAAAPRGTSMEHPMKLRVKLRGRTYEVEVETVDQSGLGSAALRVEGSPAGPPVARPAGSASSNQAAAARAAAASQAPAPTASPVQSAAPPSPADASPPAAQPAPETAPVPVAPRPPWHGLTVGGPGECLAPIPGVIASILVKVGDAVKANDPLVQLEASHVVSPQEKPLVGTVRAIEGGTVSEVAVARGDAVGFGQVLIRMKTGA
ncbi:MAG: hypothetical protein IT436_12255 [Phycisphaerales bacterium]|nr:hypothetical protein [Phycisphaerales bacterium]